MRYLLLICICACLHGCVQDTAKEAWNVIVKNCAGSDLTGGAIQYFGPSNNVGPGWRPGPDGGYRLRYSLGDMPGEKNFITRGEPYKCGDQGFLIFFSTDLIPRRQLMAGLSERNC